MDIASCYSIPNSLCKRQRWRQGMMRTVFLFSMQTTQRLGSMRSWSRRALSLEILSSPVFNSSSISSNSVGPRSLRYEDSHRIRSSFLVNSATCASDFFNFSSISHCLRISLATWSLACFSFSSNFCINLEASRNLCSRRGLCSIASVALFEWQVYLLTLQILTTMSKMFHMLWCVMILTFFYFFNRHLRSTIFSSLVYISQ